MNEITKIDTVQQYNEYFGVDTLHPLVSVIDSRKAKPLRYYHKLYNVYVILIKDTDCGSLKYGRSLYDYQQGAMLFLAPGQMMGSEDDGLLHKPEGWVLTFHPELLRGTPLAQIMKDYNYQRNILQVGITISATFQPLVQEDDRIYAERISDIVTSDCLEAPLPARKYLKKRLQY